MHKTLFLDLDGVLVDFVKGCLDIHNIKSPYKYIRWNLPEQFGIEPHSFWSPLGEEFWANLDWMPEGKKLLGRLEELFEDRIVLVSSPCGTPGCDEGKRKWVKKHIPDYAKKCFLGSEKHHFAAPCKVLIDDHETNIDNFVKSSGNGFLVPRPWNRNIDLTDENGLYCVDKFISKLSAELEI